MKITICKSYKIEYAHHIENQKITESNPEARCRNIHGHSGVVKVYIKRRTSDLDNLGMVIDFTELKPIKNFIDKFDHAMILSAYDWNLDKFIDSDNVDAWLSSDPDTDHLFIEFPRLVILKYHNISSEIIAKFMFNIISKILLPQINENLELVKVEFSETENNLVSVEA